MWTAEDRLVSAAGPARLKAWTYGVADRLLVAAQAARDPGDVLAARAGGDDLTAAEGEGIGGAQALLHRVALGVRQRTHKEGSFMRPSVPHTLPPALRLH